MPKKFRAGSKTKQQKGWNDLPEDDKQAALAQANEDMNCEHLLIVAHGALMAIVADAIAIGREIPQVPPEVGAMISVDDAITHGLVGTPTVVAVGTAAGNPSDKSSPFVQ